VKPIEDGVRATAFALIHRSVRRRLVQVDGAHNIPIDGAFILAPNHSSYFDHYLVETVLFSARGKPTWFLTKSEAFDKPISRFWHNVMRCIPVDRGRPTAATLARIGQALADGRALVIYPEGTRGPGDRLLPFKDGAFWFAVRHDVAVIPVGIAGADQVLAKGTRWPRKAPLRIVFGEALTDNPSLSRSQRIQTLRLQAERRIPELMADAAMPGADPSGALGLEVGRQIDASLRPDGRCPAEALRRLGLLAALVPDRGTAEIELPAQRLRLRGLRAMSAGPLRRPVLAYPVRRRALRLLRRNPEHPMANYLVGRWHLTMPRSLGGRPETGVEHLSRATATAPRSDTRFAMGLAEALVAAGHPDEAVTPLALVIEHTPPTDRGYRRVQRAQALLSAVNSRPSGVPDDAPVQTFAVTAAVGGST
jgi:1-acyl-sn-glycerol-3-phosphate acyltransferase